MAYTPKTWVTGETITAEALNHLEQGVANEQAGPPGAAGADGTNGKSAYQIAVDNGFVGTEAQWLESLHGSDGQDGQDGAPGTNGTDGVDGATGPQGEPGEGVPPGGTAGQVLAKKTAADYDTEWIDPPEGGGESTPGKNGVTFTPSISEDGTISWTNDGGLPNPNPVNIRGPAGVDGAPGPKGEPGATTADGVSFDPGNTGMAAENVQGAIIKLFTSVSDGKSMIASAITDKGVETAADANFETMRQNIMDIPSSQTGTFSIQLHSNDEERGKVYGAGSASGGMTVIAKAVPEDENRFEGWIEQGELVSEQEEYPFEVNRNRNLLASFVYIPGGVTWKEGTLPAAFSGSTFINMIYDGSKFVIVESSYHTTSENGVDWQRTYHSTFGSPEDVTYNGTYYVAVLYNKSNCVYSSDLVTWKTATMPATAYWNCITYGNGKFVALSTTTTAAYSTNGTSWTKFTMLSGSWNDIIYADGKFIAVGSSSIAYSTTGTSYTKATITGATPNTLYSVTYGNGVYVVVGLSGTICHSTDGINWVCIRHQSGIKLNSVAFGNGRFIAVGGSSSGKTNQYLCSPDGINWEVAPMPIKTPLEWTDVAFGNGRFVAIAASTDQFVYSEINPIP